MLGFGFVIIFTTEANVSLILCLEMENVSVKIEERVVQGDERQVAGAEAREEFSETVKDIDDIQTPSKACTNDTEKNRDVDEKDQPAKSDTVAGLDKGADGEKADAIESDQNVQDEEDKSQEEEDKDQVNGDPPEDEEQRTKLFQEGLQYDKDGNRTEALKCYLKCLVGLKENSRFALLPQCLRNIGDIYFSRDEYEKAISFIQAEKLYYESVLIDDSELQRHIDEASGQASTEEINMDTLRATEYEQLARLCMDEKQPQLALEYAGKATKLRQKVFGDGHPVVQQTLDFFATVYAEVGKVQYTESMTKYDPSEKPDLSGETTGSGDSAPPSPTNEPTSILRKRKSTGDDQRTRRVTFDESQIPPDATNDRGWTQLKERCARFVLLLLFFTLLLVLLILGVYISCSLTQSTGCRNVRRLIYDAVMRLRYLYYHYTTTAQDVHYA
ncbi:uncharacterized protein LOC128209062 isoform X3 [Mya arenaria]|uniref:uncharacterized protein LOC128209062 isoform X3 n=1 Tax=Mya arenaria TaxID=6604 RepID=UPI0022E71628|nr:uncharacterized protein LOC128209062 isoform X3 [Mya arenaria]